MAEMIFEKASPATPAMVQRKSGAILQDNRDERTGSAQLVENRAPVQRKNGATLQDNRDKGTGSAQLVDNRAPVQRNNTGLPDKLKSGVENLSGMSMDHVRVHYNSPKPMAMQAHAYAQGNNIHLGPGQEKHLPHEAWHVVQQAQGRVKPTVQMKAGVAVNDDAGLEHEADVMGGKALGVAQMHMNGDIGMFEQTPSPSADGVVQRAALLVGTAGNLKEPGRQQQLLRAAMSVGSALPFAVAKVDDAKPGSRIPTVTHWVARETGETVVRAGEDIDIMGHSVSGMPAGISPEEMVTSLSKIFHVEDNWQGGVRIFSCYAAQATNKPGEQNNSYISTLGRTMAQSGGGLSGVKGVGGTEGKGNLGPSSGAVLGLGSENVKLRKLLENVPKTEKGLNQMFNCINAKYGFGRLGKIVHITFSEEDKLRAQTAHNLKNRGELQSIFFTALNRASHTPSQWKVARPQAKTAWEPTAMPLVGDNPGQVKFLRSFKLRVEAKEAASYTPPASKTSDPRSEPPPRKARIGGALLARPIGRK